MLLVKKEEQLVALDGSSQVAAKIVVTVLGTRHSEEVVVGGIGVQYFVPQIIPRGGMPVVAARLRDNIHHNASADAVFGLEIVGENRNFLDRFQAGRDRRLPITAMIDVAAAVQVHLRLPAILAIDTKIVVAVGVELSANDALVIDRSCARDDFQECRPVAPLGRHFRHLSGLNSRRTDAIFGLDQGSFCSNVDARRGCPFDL